MPREPETSRTSRRRPWRDGNSSSCWIRRALRRIGYCLWVPHAHRRVFRERGNGDSLFHVLCRRRDLLAAKFFPIMNGGELAIVLCWVFFFIIFYGPGRWSIDALLTKGRTSAPAS